MRKILALICNEKILTKQDIHRYYDLLYIQEGMEHNSIFRKQQWVFEQRVILVVLLNTMGDIHGYNNNNIIHEVLDHFPSAYIDVT